MSAQSTGDPQLYSWQDFLRFQAVYEGPERFVWDRGHIVQIMTGGTERHDLVVMALVRQLQAQLRSGPCHVFAHNRQVKTRQRSYYPDLLVRCGRATDPLYEDDAQLIIEVLSPSNAPSERARMLDDYRSLPSLEAVLFVDTRRRLVTIHERAEEGWTECERRNGNLTLVADLTIDLTAMWVEVDEAASFD